MLDKFNIQRIVDAASVVDVISDYIQLKKCGSEYQCLCPFHSDRHMGSFKVSPRINRYHCFSCEADGDAVDFLRSYAGMSFPDAIKYLGAKYGIMVEGAEQFHPKPCKPHAPAPRLPMLVLPTSFAKSRQQLDRDNLANFIKHLPWNTEQRARINKTFNNYLLGHTRNKGEYTIFWEIDEKGQVRTGKMMMYKEDGHRDKECEYGKSWVDYRLKKAHAQDPDGFEQAYGFNPNNFERVRTLFGMHLIDFYPKATINIVESEKTALICAIYFGDTEDNLWLATGGKECLKPDVLAPLFERKRSICLYPDYDGIDSWQKDAEGFGYDYIKVHKAFVLRNWIEADGPKADIADILVRILQETKPAKELRAAQTIAEMVQKNPAVQMLIDKLHLEPIIEP